MFAKQKNSGSNTSNNIRLSKQKQSKSGMVTSSVEKKALMQLKIEKLKMPQNNKSKDGGTSSKKSATMLKSHANHTNVAPKKCNGKGDEQPSLCNLLKNIEIGVQVNDKDFIESDEDAAVIYPSRRILALVNQWRKQKLDEERRLLLRQVRVFGKGQAKQERHITNLNEFLDKGSITRKNKKKIPDSPSLSSFFDNSKPKVTVFDGTSPKSNRESTTKLTTTNSGGEVSSNGSSSIKLDKAESFSEINERIRKKEEQLLGLIDSI